MLTRTPLSDNIKAALNFVSLGEWEKISSEYDHYFHLRLIVNLYNDDGNLQQIQLEKRARVNVFDDLRGNNEYTEYMAAGTPDPITLNELVENTRINVGNYRFYSYDGFNNNCQGFVKMLLETMGLWNERNKKFTYQDTTHVVNQLPYISQKIIRFIPVLGNIVESRILGKGEPDQLKAGFIVPDEYIPDFSPDYKNLPHEAVSNLLKYGNLKINRIQIVRTPIEPAIKTALHVISVGYFEQARIEQGYDHFFHLCMIVDTYDDNGNLIQLQIEKLARVSITDYLHDINEHSEMISVGHPDQPTSINEMIVNTRNRVGDLEFYSYDGFSNNCQGFMKMLLETIGMWNNRNKKFLYQDAVTTMNKLPYISQKIIRFLPVLGNIIDSRIIGKGEPDQYGNIINPPKKGIPEPYIHDKGIQDMKIHAVLVKNTVPISEAKKIAGEILKTRKKLYHKDTKDFYRFRNIPKTKFKKFRTKKVNDTTEIIFGLLK